MKFRKTVFLLTAVSSVSTSVFSQDEYDPERDDEKVTLISSHDPRNETRELNNIVVTALRDSIYQNDISTSVSILDDETLESAGQQHFQDVIELVPNLNWAAGSNRPRYFQIRGIGERSQYEGAPNPSVGFLVDDIDFSALGGVATLFDVEQIEVLRGPQGTRYGANALAGLIYVKTKDPEFFPEYKITTLIGDDGDRSVGFSATGALSDSEKAAYRLSVQRYRSDGFRYNDFFDVDDTNGRDELVLRNKLFFSINDSWDSKLTLMLTDIDNGYDAFAPENTLTVHSDKPGRDAQKSVGLGWRNEWVTASGLQVLSITGYSDSEIDYDFDGDWGNPIYWGEFAPYDFTSANDRERQNISQEFRIISGDSQRLFNDSTDWIVGLYGLDLKEDNQIIELFNDEVFRTLDSEFDATSLAIFAQLDTHISEATTFSSGLRFERRDSDYVDSSGLDLSPSDNMFGGQLSLHHEVNDSYSVYTTLSRGYKAGGFNLSLSVPDDRREYDPEFLWNLETGIKGLFFDYRLQTNISLFYSERKDMQVSTSFQPDPQDPLTFVFFTGNAAEGRNYGLEAEWRFSINQNFSMHGSLGLLETEFSEFETASGNISGRDQAHAPSYQFNIGGEYKSDNGFFVRLDVNGSDEFFFSDSHDQRSDAYELVNIKLGYQADNWAVYGWGRNIFDENYAVRGFFFGLEPPEFNDTLYKQLGDPSHFGISAEYRF